MRNTKPKTKDGARRKKIERGLVDQYQSKLQKAVVELQRTQQQLIQSEKMASLGTIAAGVAHEINNPLSFLLSNMESLEVYMKTFRDLLDRYELLASVVKPGLKPEAGPGPRSGALDPRAYPIIDEIEGMRRRKDVAYMIGDYESLLKESLEGISRIREIVQSLQTFSRAYGEESEPVDVNECIATALRVVSNELKYKCVLQKDFGSIPKVSCNPGHLLQVFMNILLNAAQAIHERGTIGIRTYADESSIFASVTDSGCGIAPENMARLFTPFFTTKPIGQGTGLGLSVSYGIIKGLKGGIDVSSEPGKGSTFTVRIPYRGGER